MEWIIVIILAFLLGSWLLKGLQNYNIQRQRKLKAAELLKLIRPTFEKVYSQLTNEVSSKYPFIPFQFPTQEALLVNSENILLRYSSVDPSKVIKRLLDPLIVKAKTDFISYKPNFIPDEVISTESHPRLLPNVSIESQTDFRNPSDWDERRQMVHVRDKGRCQRCGL